MQSRRRRLAVFVLGMLVVAAGAFGASGPAARALAAPVAAPAPFFGLAASPAQPPPPPPAIQPAEFASRRAALAQRAGDGALCALRNYQPGNDEDFNVRGPTFRGDSSFLYLTGISCRGAVCVVGAAGKTLVLLPDALSAGERRRLTRRLKTEAGITRVESLKDARRALLREFPAAQVQALIVNLRGWGRTAAPRFPELAARLTNAYPEATLKTGRAASVRRLLGALRPIKTPAELALMRQAARITSDALRLTIRHARPGLYEADLQALLEGEFRARGTTHNAFGSIVGSGINGVTLHYMTNTSRIEAGMCVVMDVGAEYRGYATDLTRTFPISGRFTPRQREIYTQVYDNQQHCLKLVKPGVTLRALDRESREFYRNKGHDAQAIRRFYPHGLGHYVGLDVHDPGGRGPFVPGVVITIEPGWYTRAEKLGVRIEDTVLVTKTGRDELTRGVDASPEAIEKLVGSAYRDWRAVGLTVDFMREPHPEGGPDLAPGSGGLVPEFLGLVVRGFDEMDATLAALDLRLGDRLIALNGTPVLRAERLLAEFASGRARALSAEVFRAGKRLTLVARPIGHPRSRPDPRLLAMLGRVSHTRLVAALEGLQALGASARPPGSDRARKVRQWLAAELAKLKATPPPGAEQRADYDPKRPFAEPFERRARDLRGGENVIARGINLRAVIPAAVGSPKGPRVVLVVPYDLEPEAATPDDAALVVALATARALAGRRHPPLELMFVSAAFGRKPSFAPGIPGESPDRAPQPEALVIGISQLWPGKEFRLGVGIAAATKALRDPLTAGLKKLASVSPFATQPIGVRPWPVIAAKRAQWVDVTLLPPPGMPVVAPDLRRHDVLALSELARWLSGSVARLAALPAAAPPHGPGGGRR